MSYWRIRHDRQTLFAAPWEQVTFDSAIFHIVEHLIGDNLSATWQCERLFHVVEVEIAHSVVPDLASLLERMKCFQSLSQRNRSAPVQQINVEIIGLQSPQ